MKENDSLEKIVQDIKQAYSLTEEKAQNEQDKDKKEMYIKMLANVKQVLDKVEGVQSNDLKQELLSASSDVISTWLDESNGKSVTDNSIFQNLPRHFESEFHKDMAALNVRKMFFMS